MPKFFLSCVRLNLLEKSQHKFSIGAMTEKRESSAQHTLFFAYSTLNFFSPIHFRIDTAKDTASCVPYYILYVCWGRKKSSFESIYHQAQFRGLNSRQLTALDWLLLMNDANAHNYRRFH